MSFATSYYHCVFCTKHRQNIIDPALKKELQPFIGGLARHYKMKLIEINCMPDHVHMLLPLPPTLCPAEAMKLIKGGSSRWINETFPQYRHFSWQKKYGAFGVCDDHLNIVVRYIKGQEEHHRTISSRDEFIALLTEHHIEFDVRYIEE